MSGAGSGGEGKELLFGRTTGTLWHPLNWYRRWCSRRCAAKKMCSRRCAAKKMSDLFKSVENGRAKSAIDVGRRRSWSFEKMKHIFSGLLEIIFGKGIFSGKKLTVRTSRSDIVSGK
jgi:hypothetical protein